MRRIMSSSKVDPIKNSLKENTDDCKYKSSTEFLRKIGVLEDSTETAPPTQSVNDKTIATYLKEIDLPIIEHDFVKDPLEAYSDTPKYDLDCLLQFRYTPEMSATSSGLHTYLADSLEILPIAFKVKYKNAGSRDIVSLFDITSGDKEANDVSMKIVCDRHVHNKYISNWIDLRDHTYIGHKYKILFSTSCDIKSVAIMSIIRSRHALSTISEIILPYSLSPEDIRNIINLKLVALRNAAVCDQVKLLEYLFDKIQQERGRPIDGKDVSTILSSAVGSGAFKCCEYIVNRFDNIDTSAAEALALSRQDSRILKAIWSKK